MSVRPLRYLGDPVLRTASDPVARFDDALAGLIEDLLDTVQEPGRAGLAANQIGSGLAAFSYNVDGQLGYLINPRFVELTGEADGAEGCLSIPGISAMRRRAARAIVAGLNLQQEQVIVLGFGMARKDHDSVVGRGQFDVDHLDRGELFQHGFGCQSRRQSLQPLLERHHQAIGEEGHEDVSFDAGFELVMDGPHRKIVLQFLERLLDIP